MANSVQEALKKEKTVKPDEVWKDEKQPEEPSPTDRIGFEYSSKDSYISHSPYMKRKKRKKRR